MPKSVSLMTTDTSGRAVLRRSLCRSLGFGSLSRPDDASAGASLAEWAADPGGTEPGDPDPREPDAGGEADPDPTEPEGVGVDNADSIEPARVASPMVESHQPATTVLDQSAVVLAPGQFVAAKNVDKPKKRFGVFPAVVLIAAGAALIAGIWSSQTGETPTPTVTATATLAVNCVSFQTGVCCTDSSGTSCSATVCTTNSNCGSAPFLTCAGASADDGRLNRANSSTYPPSTTIVPSVPLSSTRRG